MYLLLIVDIYVITFYIYWLKYCYCVVSLVFINDKLGISDMDDNGEFEGDCE